MILYKSKYGSTKQYAEWLAEALNADMVELDSATYKQLRGYEKLIIGSHVMASGVKGIKWLKKNYDHLGGKRIALFAVGASPANEKDIQILRERSLGKELEALPLFYLRGRWNEPSMTWPDRKLCGFLKKEIQKKSVEELESWERALLEAYQQGGEVALDWMSREQLDPLLRWASK